MHRFHARTSQRQLNALKLAVAILSCTVPLHVAGQVRAPTAWPPVELPADAQTFDVGGEFLSNGMPTRAIGFISPRGISAVSDWFRRNTATVWLIERMPDATVLGRSEGQHFITIKLTPLRDGTRGLMSIVDLAKASQEQPSLHARVKQWLSDLPSGTQLINHVASNDAGRLSEHLMLVNQQSEAVNMRSVSATLLKRGYAVERTLDPSSANLAFSSALSDTKAPAGKAMLFKSGTREAVAVFFRGDAGQSVITINTINTIMQDQP